MGSLQEICIAVIIKHITSIITFLHTSPLPLKLTWEIAKKFSMYKWHHINSEARSDHSTFVVSLEFLEYEHQMHSIRARNAALTAFTLEHTFMRDKYCIWHSHYRIKELNLRLCHGCCKRLKEVLKWINKKVTVVRDHNHEVSKISEIHTLYKVRNLWCQNSFDEVLFRLHSLDDCQMNLHYFSDNSQPISTRFVDYHSDWSSSETGSDSE